MQVLEKSKWDINIRLQDHENRFGTEKLSSKLDRLMKKYLGKLNKGCPVMAKWDSFLPGTVRLASKNYRSWVEKKKISHLG